MKKKSNDGTHIDMFSYTYHVYYLHHHHRSKHSFANIWIFYVESRILFVFFNLCEINICIMYFMSGKKLSERFSQNVFLLLFLFHIYKQEMAGERREQLRQQRRRKEEIDEMMYSGSCLRSSYIHICKERLFVLLNESGESMNLFSVNIHI